MLDVPFRVRAADVAGAVRVHALGRFRLTRDDGEPIAVRSRKARAVLAYLALSGGSASREEIAALLWSDRGEEQSRASLRQTLHELRRLDWDDGEAPIVADGETLALRPGALTHDLGELRMAAKDNDLGKLTELLNDAAPNGSLLADLDGIDREFDQWLRQLRAREPGDAIDSVLAAADRAFAAGRHHEVKALLASLEACDPTREDVARLQFKVAHALQDYPGIARRWDRLVAALDGELGTKPSASTEQLFRSLAEPGCGEVEPLALVSRLEGIEAAPRPTAKPWPFLAIAGLLLCLAGVAAAWWWTSRPAAEPGRPLVVAVLPFRTQTGSPDFLAAGIWEDTRTALARNPGLRLLGRETTDASASARLTPAEWRRRTGADYLLGGYLQRQGARIALTAELTRTTDGLVIWQGTFTAPTGEPTAGQGGIAASIEGQLRSQLAPGGGTRAEQITTSSDVQALYGEARSLLATRRFESHVRARGLLREAVRRDPQYAPAWAALAKAAFFTNARAVDDSALREESLRAGRRALQLAPNLAEAHAVAGLLEGDRRSIALFHLRRAVALDPSSVDAWNWLGNALNQEGLVDESLIAYDRAVRLDPLFTPALTNLVQTAGDLGRLALIDQTINRAQLAGAGPDVLAGLRATKALSIEDLSAAVAALRAGGLDDEGRSRPAAQKGWIETLGRLGMFDELERVIGSPRWYGPLVKGEIDPPAIIDGHKVEANDYWLSFYFGYPASRALVNHGKSADLVRYYRAAFADADAFFAETRRAQTMNGSVTTLAMALQEQGAMDESAYLLANAERDLASATARPWESDDLADLAAIKAAQGEHREALALLGQAIDRKWLPDGRVKPTDLRQEPAFAKLRGNPRFEALRSRILATVARERAEIGPLPL